MRINRRSFLKTAISIPLFNSSLVTSHAESDSLGLMLAACSDEKEQNYIALFRLETLEYKLIPLTERGHALAIHPYITNQAVIAARRPGNSLTLINIDLGTIITKVSSNPDRHFYGHCSYTQNGEYLLTTENDYENGIGVISIRDSQTLKVIDEIPSFGIGPHDLEFMPDQKTIVIANGGILTHPDTGRRKLNLNEMKPSLAYVDLIGAKLIDQYYLSDPKLSIRHIDVNQAGEVGIATQDQAEYLSDANKISLIAMHKNKDRQPDLIQIPKNITLSLNRYTADFCFEPSHNTALVSSPRGNQILIFNTKNQTLVRSYPVNQPSAVALSRDKNYFVVSTAYGEILFINTNTSTINSEMTQFIQGVIWDNHMTVV